MDELHTIHTPVFVTDEGPNKCMHQKAVLKDSWDEDNGRTRTLLCRSCSDIGYKHHWEKDT